MSVAILQGNCLDVLRGLEAERFHAVVTSVPYWGLRDYGIPPSVWGGDPAHAHAWGPERIIRGQSTPQSGLLETGNGRPETRAKRLKDRHILDRSTGAFCACGAWRGTLGLEPSPAMWVDNLVAVFAEVWRVLRPDGTVWLNVGDAYCRDGGRLPTTTREVGERVPSGWCVNARAQACDTRPVDGLKVKDLIGLPWRLAFGLQDAGWYLRSEILWEKPNMMPESVKDRPSKSHEYVFLLAKGERYFYDQVGYLEPTVSLDPGHSSYRPKSEQIAGLEAGREVTTGAKHARTARYYNATGRNARTVWRIETEPYSDQHFAIMPRELARRCIVLGTSEAGACASCGTPLERQVAKMRNFESGSGRSGNDPAGKHGLHLQGGGETRDVRRGPVLTIETLGWTPVCGCGHRRTVPCEVLDPFGGSGTTGLVAQDHGRRATLIELNPDYIAQARKRTAQGGLFAQRQEVAS